MLGEVDSQRVRWPLIIYNNDYIRISNTRLKFKFLLRIRDRRSFRGGAALRNMRLLEGARIGQMGIFSILGGGSVGLNEGTWQQIRGEGRRLTEKDRMFPICRQRVERGCMI